MSLDVKFGVREIPGNEAKEIVSRIKPQRLRGEMKGFGVFMDRLLTGLRARKLVRVADE